MAYKAPRSRARHRVFRFRVLGWGELEPHSSSTLHKFRFLMFSSFFSLHCASALASAGGDGRWWFFGAGGDMPFMLFESEREDGSHVQRRIRSGNW